MGVLLSARRVACALGVTTLVTLAACVPDPPPPTVPRVASIDPVAGVDAYDPYQALTPATPGPALGLHVNVYARSVAPVDADSVLVANYNEIVRFEESAGTVQRVAGRGTDPVIGSSSGVPLPAAFDGPALDAQIGEPYWITPAPDGSVYFVPNGSGWIARLAPDGTLVKVAGTGGFPPARSGDGGPAVDAGLGDISNLTLGPDGDLAFVDVMDTGAVVRRIDAGTGTIDTVWTRPPNGAWPAQFGLDVAADGTIRDLTFDDIGSPLVRTLTGPSTDTTTAFSGDCASATNATALHGELADGRRELLDRSATLAAPRICTVDPLTGATTARPLDSAAAAALFQDPEVLAPIGDIGLGPDGRRWLTAWRRHDTGDTLRFYRWDPAE